MELSNELVLRPRFKLELNQSNDQALKTFEAVKKTQSKYNISVIDDHVFIKIPKHKQSFWSPQLHLEINALDRSKCLLHGNFGPNPTVWTMFMFFHFLIAILFIGFAIWTYTNYALDNSFVIQLVTMLFLVLMWAGLYLGGRIGKAKVKREMYAQYKFLLKTLQL